MDRELVWTDAALGAATIVKLETDHGSIDLHWNVAGIGAFPEARARSVQIHAFGREVWTLDLPALIDAKRAAGRAKDILALPELERLLAARK